ncbi:ATP-binding protein [Mycobacterium shimoidei]|uniref:Regulatory protein [Mycobacterium leprae TN] n=1 Tax=Mycobacterium shimoidei TaxID=29313 RepID=A0A375YXK8_MYCSH|nr:adenylate/guanylate cyclase domain-containing protein [Mycobacterium shimoidei]MCV7261020.1 AAA family ATPase [Mycobacterium shimoidei]SRX93618.1 regulatory protein [Mycobacterium leprae TN] [Mycobacterium shimoidei]
MDRSGDGGLTASGRFCRACGAWSSPTAKFCGECGRLLADITPSAEYKQATVLFADVVHSVEIAAAVGEERLREIMAQLVDKATAVVRRFGGTVDKFTGDGVKAVFGAPMALEDHAVRACLAALGIQAEIARLAAEVSDSDGVALALRIGLHSGQVIAGEIGSRPLGYTTIGEPLGMARHMESVAPPGGVMLSSSTARLVDGIAAVGEPELIHLKGVDLPVPARRLLGMAEGHRAAWRAQSSLVGRRPEISMLEGILDRAVDGHGAVVRVVGPPGIGKSRLVRELAALAVRRDAEVFTAICESHASQIPFHVIARLLRAATGVDGLDERVARDRVRVRVTADPEDLALFDELLGIADPNAAIPVIDPDARRRRLTALVNAAALARKSPAVYVIEDAHWIDKVSESMLVELLTVIPQMPSLVLFTYRPEYDGPLMRVHGAQTIALAPLSDSEAAALVKELLGPDASVVGLGRTIADRAAGNPFFVEEIVRDLADRNLLRGTPGAYVSATDGAQVSVPATLVATIAARIDRLDPDAKRTLSAAAVVGSRFGLDLLTALGVEPVVDDLIVAGFIHQISFVCQPEYAFDHPLIRAVAYESQLKSDRAELHRRLAAAIEAREPESIDENAALIADHLEAAGDLHAAFGWHMRAGNWSTHRDITGARMSWERARQVADRLPADDVHRTAMRIAPRTLLCATIWRVSASPDDIRFDELRELATAAGDQRSLVIGMTGLVTLMQFYGKYTEASRLASHHVELLDSIGDPELTVGVLMTPMIVKWSVGEVSVAMELSQRAIDTSQGDPTMGNMIVGSPLAFALVMRASARCALGIAGWRQDFDDAVALARRTDKFTFCTVVMFKYIATLSWALLPDDDALRDTAEAVEIAQQFGDDFTLTNAEFTRGLVLVRREDADRKLGFELLDRARRVALEHRNIIVAAWCADIDFAAEKNRTGDYDGAIALCRAVLASEIRSGEMTNRGWCTTVLVEALLNRGRAGDLDEAQDAIDSLAATPTEPGFLYHELPLLRLNAMLAEARGDEDRYREFRDRYRARAQSTGFEGHIALAHAMV